MSAHDKYWLWLLVVFEIDPNHSLTDQSLCCERQFLTAVFQMQLSLLWWIEWAILLLSATTCICLEKSLNQETPTFQWCYLVHLVDDRLYLSKSCTIILILNKNDIQRLPSHFDIWLEGLELFRQSYNSQKIF